MFFLLELKKNVQLSPRFFGPKMVSTLQDKLIAEVRREETCTPAREDTTLEPEAKPTG